MTKAEDWGDTRAPPRTAPPASTNPRVIRFSVAAAWAVTAGWRLPVSVTPTPRRTRLKRRRAAKLPNRVQASIAASGDRNRRAAALGR
jgi:hypothetical protein